MGNVITLYFPLAQTSTEFAQDELFASLREHDCTKARRLHSCRPAAALTCTGHSLQRARSRGWAPWRAPRAARSAEKCHLPLEPSWRRQRPRQRLPSRAWRRAWKAEKDERGNRPAENLPPGRAHRAGQGRGLPQRAGARPRGGTDRGRLPCSASLMDSFPRSGPGPGSPLTSALPGTLRARSRSKLPHYRASSPASPTNARSRTVLTPARAPAPAPTSPHQRALQALSARSRPELLGFLGSFGFAQTRAHASGAELAGGGGAAARPGEPWRRRPPQALRLLPRPALRPSGPPACLATL